LPLTAILFLHEPSLEQPNPIPTSPPRATANPTPTITLTTGSLRTTPQRRMKMGEYQIWINSLEKLCRRSHHHHLQITTTPHLFLSWKLSLLDWMEEPQARPLPQLPPLLTLHNRTPQAEASLSSTQSSHQPLPLQTLPTLRSPVPHSPCSTDTALHAPRLPTPVIVPVKRFLPHMRTQTDISTPPSQHPPPTLKFSTKT
jgi:hypothetical protein